ncbi:MAG: CheB methylesterase domain-containing protein [Yoonia sp.]|uniref:CheB methylesterase domain-containing protein n=1 Tax=Yoonia sp. TaxID=2212373 RepID=UPI003EF7F3E2
MKILYCHAAPIQQQSMRRLLAQAMPAADLMKADGLTQAYDLVEHTQPDCLVVGARLVAFPKFDLLGALLRLTAMGLIVWGTAASTNAAAVGWHGITFDPGEGSKSLADVLASALSPQPKLNVASLTKVPQSPFDSKSLLLIGASTGGVDALAKILAHLDGSTPPTLIVQHTGGRFTKSLIRFLDSATKATVVPAQDRMGLKRGHVYLAPDDSVHLTLDQNRPATIRLVEGAPVSGHRPSVNALFQSALVQGRRISAALLTGMGQDGAQGLLALREAGAHTIAQDRASSVVYGMPRVAAELGAAVEILSIDAIGPALLNAARAKVKS